MNVLVVNAGSSSLKYQLIETKAGELKAKGICERIGQEGSVITHTTGDGTKIVKELAMPNHAVAMKFVVDALTDAETGCIKDMSEIEAVGHRVVHGGPYYSESCLVTPEVLEKLELCRDFAPLHTGAHLMGISGCTEVMPNVPQVLVFDTAFHQTMPEEAYYYPITKEIYDTYKVRRYGAHGTSHRYVSKIMCDILGKKEGTKIITCHLGNGSSISAVKDGKCIDTSMGFTPLDGVEMGSRCGSIDPAIVPYIMNKKGFTPDEMSDFMNKKCGFLGTTGYTDARDLEATIKKGPSDPNYENCMLAYKVLFYQIKKYIGGYAAAMDGLDAIVFTAGLGENNVRLRSEVCKNLSYFGIEIDEEINAKTTCQSNVVKISTENSKVLVYVIPTNEELVIAQDTTAIVEAL